MKKHFALLLALLVALSLSACGGKPAPGPDAAPSAGSSSVQEETSSLPEDLPPAPALPDTHWEEEPDPDYQAEREAVLEAAPEELLWEIFGDSLGPDAPLDSVLAFYELYAYADFNPDSYRQTDLPNVRDAESLMYDEYDVESVLYSDLIEAFVACDSPQLRAYAYSQLEEWGEPDEEILAMVEDALSIEDDPRVITAAIDHLILFLDDWPELLPYLENFASGTDPIVRRAVALGLSRGFDTVDVSGLAIALANDQNMDVAAPAVEALARLGNTEAIPLAAAILEDPELRDYHVLACSALEHLWYDRPLYRHREEAAYRAFLDYLKPCPEDSSIPVFQAFAVLEEGLDAQWMQSTEWFDADELAQCLQSLAGDASLSSLVQDSAQEALEALRN